MYFDSGSGSRRRFSITRITCSSCVHTCGGSSPRKPSASRSASVKAVPLFSRGSRSSAAPRRAAVGASDAGSGADTGGTDAGNTARRLASGIADSWPARCGREARGGRRERPCRSPPQTAAATRARRQRVSLRHARPATRAPCAVARDRRRRVSDGAMLAPARCARLTAVNARTRRGCSTACRSMRLRARPTALRVRPTWATGGGTDAIGDVDGAPPRAARFYSPAAASLRRTYAICVCSGSSFGQTSWQASSVMQPNTPSSLPTSS